MASFNKVILLGNLTRDPEIKALPSGTTVATFGLAVNRRFSSQNGEAKEEVTFVDINAFGKQAETLAKYCAKGRPLMVEGRLKLDSWTDKEGRKQSKLSVVLENFQLLGGRDESAPAQAPTKAAAPAAAAPAPAPGDDDVPF